MDGVGGGRGGGSPPPPSPQLSQQPPPTPDPDINISKRLLGPVITFYILAVSLSSLRLYTRLTTGTTTTSPSRFLPCHHHHHHPPSPPSPPNTYKFKFSWDDTTLLLATLLTTLQFALLLAAIPHGVGRHNIHVPYPDQVTANRLLLISQIPWGWSVALAKISIACLLLRLKSATAAGAWRVSLYAMIAVQLASAVSANVVQLGQCRPLYAVWDPVGAEGARCWDVGVAHGVIYANGVVAVVSDVFLAATPISFLKDVRRSVRERAVLILLMGLGVFTAVATVVKLTLVEPYGKYGDGLWDTIDISTWSCVEAYMGIIAASLPCLKSPFERFLRRVGLIKGGSESGGGGSQGSSGDFSNGGFDGRYDLDVVAARGSEHHHPECGHEQGVDGVSRSKRLSSILSAASKAAKGGKTRDVLLTVDATSSEQSIIDHSERRREDV